MVKLSLIFLSILTGIGWHIHNVKNANLLKVKGAEFYNIKQYPQALQCYYDLSIKYHSKEEEVLINLANCYYQLGALESSKKGYLSLSKSDNKSIKSQANTQLGILEALAGRRKTGLQFFKIALMTDPANKIARYNFELLLKQKPDRKNKDPKRKTKVSNKSTGGQDAEMESEEDDETEEDIEDASETDGSNATQTSHKMGSNESKKGEENREKWKSNSQNSKKHNLDKALLILESLKQQEVNYLQRKIYYTPSQKKSKPDMDW